MSKIGFRLKYNHYENVLKWLEKNHSPNVLWLQEFSLYSTVTDLARFLGQSTLQPRNTAM